MKRHYRCPISQIIRLKEGVIKNKNKNSDREKLSYTLFQRLHRWIQMQKKCMTEFSLGLIQKHAQKSRWSPLKIITSKSHAEHNNCWWMKDHLRASSSDRESCWEKNNYLRAAFNQLITLVNRNSKQKHTKTKNNLHRESNVLTAL